MPSPHSQKTYLQGYINSRWSPLHITLITLVRQNFSASYLVVFVQWLSLHLIRSYSATPNPFQGINDFLLGCHRCLLFCSPAGRCGLIGCHSFCSFPMCLQSLHFFRSSFNSATFSTPHKSSSFTTLSLPDTQSKKLRQPAVNSRRQSSPSGFLFLSPPLLHSQSARYVSFHYLSIHFIPLAAHATVSRSANNKVKPCGF